MNRLYLLPLRGIQWLIVLYQNTMSPDHGLFRSLFPAGVCRFEPTCSEYMYHAISLHGWRGLELGLRRITKCHPFGGSGVDKVPPVHT